MGALQYCEPLRLFLKPPCHHTQQDETHDGDFVTLIVADRACGTGVILRLRRHQVVQQHPSVRLLQDTKDC